MTRRSVKKLSRQHLWLYEEDWQWLLLYGGKLGPTKIARELIHQYVLRRREEQQLRVEDAHRGADGPEPTLDELL